MTRSSAQILHTSGGVADAGYSTQQFLQNHVFMHYLQNYLDIKIHHNKLPVNSIFKSDLSRGPTRREVYLDIKILRMYLNIKILT